MAVFGSSAAEPRKGMPSPRLDEAEFKRRFLEQQLTLRSMACPLNWGRSQPRHGMHMPTRASRRGSPKQDQTSPIRTTSSPSIASRSKGRYSMRRSGAVMRRVRRASS